MAPRKETKEKVEKTSAAEGSKMIMDYLKQQNRPYSAQDISQNLHNKVTKTQAVKTLKELHEQSFIVGRTAGKQIVYHALQTPSESATPEALAFMDAEITTLRDTIASLKTEEKTLRASLSALNATMTADELQTGINGLEKEKMELLGRLEPLRAGTLRPVSKEERETVEREWRLWSKKTAERKRICMELWGMLTEEIPAGKTKDELWEEKGLEGDED